MQNSSYEGFFFNNDFIDYLCQNKDIYFKYFIAIKINAYFCTWITF